MQAVTYLFIEEEWVREVIEESGAGRLREGEFMFIDRWVIRERERVCVCVYVCRCVYVCVCF
jgi:hypothetical protein